MSADDLIARLREGLKSVTPGPWSAEQIDGFKVDRPYVVGPSDVVVGNDGICDPSDMNDRSFIEDAANMRHIARCSPDNIRLLLDTIASLKEERDRLAERVAAMEIASNGSSERCALLLSAKNHWMGRTAAAEASNEALLVALEAARTEIIGRYIERYIDGEDSRPQLMDEAAALPIIHKIDRALQDTGKEKAG